MISKRGLYAYGLIGQSPTQFAIPGIDKQHQVYPVAGKEICVMVSEIDVDIFQDQVKTLFSQFTADGIATVLQAHEDVLDLLMQNTAVVPFKFGTILKDQHAALKLLQDDEQKFKMLLAKFTGRAEWGLKVYSDNQEFTKYILQAEPACKSLPQEHLSRGAAYLLRKKMEETVKDSIVARLTEITGAIFQELGKDAYEARLHKTLPQTLIGQKKEMVLNTAYLVEQEKIATFCKQGKKLVEKYAPMGLDLEVSGPWPPYSFIYDTTNY